MLHFLIFVDFFFLHTNVFLSDILQQGSDDLKILMFTAKLR